MSHSRSGVQANFGKLSAAPSTARVTVGQLASHLESHPLGDSFAHEELQQEVFSKASSPSSSADSVDTLSSVYQSRATKQGRNARLLSGLAVGLGVAALVGSAPVGVLLLGVGSLASGMVALGQHCLASKNEYKDETLTAQCTTLQGMNVSESAQGSLFVEQ